jgi:hypothetical protein
VTLKLRNQFLDRQIATLTTRISRPETAEADRVELLRQQQELRQQKTRAAQVKRPEKPRKTIFVICYL